MQLQSFFLPHWSTSAGLPLERMCSFNALVYLCWSTSRVWLFSHLLVSPKIVVCLLQALTMFWHPPFYHWPQPQHAKVRFNWRGRIWFHLGLLNELALSIVWILDVYRFTSPCLYPSLCQSATACSQARDWAAQGRKKAERYRSRTHVRWCMCVRVRECVYSYYIQ